MRTGKIKELIITQLQSKKGKLNELLLEYSLLAQNKLNPARGFIAKLTKNYPEINKFVIGALSALAFNQVKIGLPITFVYLYLQLIAGGGHIENSVKTLTEKELREGFKEFQKIILGKLSEWEPYIKECGIDYLPKTILEVNREASEKDKEKFLRGFAPSWNVIIDGLDIERNEEGEIKELLEHEENAMLLGNSGSGKTVLMMRTAYDLIRDYAVFFSNGQIDSRKAIQFIGEPEFSEKKKVIFIDNIVLNKAEVLNLVMEAQRKSIDVNFVFAEQKERWGASKENLAVYNFKNIEIHLSKEPKEKYLAKYLKDEKIRDEILQMSKDSFPMLVMMVSGSSTNIEKIIDDMWNSIKNNDIEKAVMKTIFTCSYFDVSIPEKALKEIYKDGSVIHSLSEKGLINITGSRISAYHPLISKLMLDNEYRINDAELSEEIEQFTKIFNKPEYFKFFLLLGLEILASNYKKKNKTLISTSEKLFDKAIEINPKDDGTWDNKGIALSDLKKYKEAIECFDKAIEINPENDGAWDNKGLALAHLKRYKEAIECFDKAIEINPENDRAWDNKGLALADLKRYKEAIECYDKAIEINPKDDGAWDIKGLALAHLKRYKEAIECHDKAIEINPKNSDAWNNKGVALAHLKKYKEAIECFDKAIEINPKDDGAWNNKGLALYYLKKYKEAIECSDKAIEINPENDRAWDNKGLAIADLKRYKEAIECYDKAIEINPKDSDAWNNKGLALAHLKRYKEAIEYYDKAIEINPENDRAWNNKGLAIADLKRYKEAIEYYDKAIEINPDLSQLLYRSIQLLLCIF